jgi:hypothetical protein
MIPKLVNYLNHTVLVCIPVLHPDAKCRQYVLLGVELQGLWLQDPDLVSELTSLEKKVAVDPATPVFVPFASIAFVVLPAPVTKVVDVQALTRARPIQAATPGAVGSKRPSTHKKRSGK